MIKGFDAALPGMGLGEKKTINIPAVDAYGERSTEAIIEFDKANIPEDMKLDPHYFPMCEPPQQEPLFKTSGNKNEES